MQRRRLAVVIFLLALTAAAAGFMRLTGTQTAAGMQKSAVEFLGSLTAEQRPQATLAYDDPTRTDWHFIPKDKRKGLQIKHMEPAQRKAALALLRSGLSEIGYDKATTIMSLEEILRELEKNKSGGNIRDPERYYFAVFGAPSASGKWGWSVEGHHLSLNFVVSGGKVVSVTPSFFGANPALVTTDLSVGPKKGTRVLAKEEQLAFDLLNSLSAEQRKVAVIAEKAPDDVTGAGKAQAVKHAPAGLAAAKMSPEQVKTLEGILDASIRNVKGELADESLAEIKQAGIDKVYFAWAGADKPGIGHYYKVQGPTFVLEFCNVQPDAAGNPANHIHSLWRSLTGDFGIEN